MSDEINGQLYLLPEPEEQSVTQQLLEWLSHGMTKGWISEPSCAPHDGIPCTEEEIDNLDDEDYCMMVLRLWIPEEARG